MVTLLEVTEVGRVLDDMAQGVIFIIVAHKILHIHGRVLVKRVVVPEDDEGYLCLAED